jgi:hypothetical protein
MLRTLDQQVRAGDTEGALSVAYRYLQMGHPSRALAGIIGNVAASRDSTGEPGTFHPLVLAAAAIEEFMMVPPVIASGGQNALLTAAVRLAGEFHTGWQLAEKVQSSIDAELASGNSGS